jgi:hypothetical protein
MWFLALLPLKVKNKKYEFGNWIENRESKRYPFFLLEHAFIQL